jgi:hypothetical protein
VGINVSEKHTASIFRAEGRQRSIVVDISTLVAEYLLRVVLNRILPD